MTNQQCPFCKSPSIRNPCWYYLDSPAWVRRSGFDPPCDIPDKEIKWATRKLQKRQGYSRMWWGFWFSAAYLAIGALVAVVVHYYEPDLVGVTGEKDWLGVVLLWPLLLLP